MKKLFHSLQAKYMLIIFFAILLVQSVYLLSALLISSFDNQIRSDNIENESYAEVEANWHSAAASIQDPKSNEVTSLFLEWSNKYPQASMYWINEDGNLTTKWNSSSDIPSHWTSSYTASFIKERINGDPFTVIAFVGNNKAHGFIVFEIPRKYFNPLLKETTDQYGSILLVVSLTVIILFIIVSYLFFRRIRKRLLHLQTAMTSKNTIGLPIPIQVKKDDEIGQLEHTFNTMVVELTASKKREQQEEQLRRELIANLSHDLKTPLTKIRSQAYSISKFTITEEEKQSVLLIEKSVKQMDKLIDNLMSYTLLMSKKYQLNMREIDIIRLLRGHIATWYPVFEQAQFEIDIFLEGMQETKWNVDPIWMERILDNLFQNVLRHANNGKYIQIKTETRNNIDVIIVSDRGAGMQTSSSNEKGAGIGLSIVDMMITGQHLSWKKISTNKGLKIELYRSR